MMPQAIYALVEGRFAVMVRRKPDHYETILFTDREAEAKAMVSQLNQPGGPKRKRLIAGKREAIQVEIAA